MQKLATIFSIIVIFTIPWEDAFALGSLGTVTRIFGILTALIWFLSVLMRGKLRSFQWFHGFVLFFILWNITSIFWSRWPRTTLDQIQTYIQLCIFIFILWDLITSPELLRAGLQAYIFGAYISVTSTIINYTNGQQISAYEVGRYSGAGLNAVDLALTLTIGIPIAWHLALISSNGIGRNIIRVLNYLYIPVALFAIILTASRTALIAVIPAVVFIVFTNNRLKPTTRILAFIVLFTAMFFLQPLVPQASLERLSTVSDSIAAGDLGGRVNLWKQALQTFQENPIMGIGAGVLDTPLFLGAVAHNTYISILTELGILGFFLFLLIIGNSIYKAAIQSNWYAQLWLSILAVWAIGIFTLTWEYRKTSWLVLALVVVSAELNRKKVIQPEQTVVRKPIPAHTPAP